MTPQLCVEYQNQLSRCCGVDEVGDFSMAPTFNPRAPWRYDGYNKKPSWWTEYDTKWVKEQVESDGGGGNLKRSGTGLLVATFNNFQKKELAAYRKKVKVLYESPWRKNHADSRVKLVVADYIKPKKVSK